MVWLYNVTYACRPSSTFHFVCTKYIAHRRGALLLLAISQRTLNQVARFAQPGHATGPRRGSTSAVIVMAVAVPDKAARMIVILLGYGRAPDGPREARVRRRDSDGDGGAVGGYVAADALRTRHRSRRHGPVETRQLGEERRRRRERQARQVDVVVHVAHVVGERRDRVGRVQRLGLALRATLLPPQAPDEQREQQQNRRRYAQRQVQDEFFLVLCNSSKKAKPCQSSSVKHNPLHVNSLYFCK